jgi:hypothetical protein
VPQHHWNAIAFIAVVDVEVMHENVRHRGALRGELTRRENSRRVNLMPGSVAWGIIRMTASADRGYAYGHGIARPCFFDIFPMAGAPAT